jgi:cytochrome P450
MAALTEAQGDTSQLAEDELLMMVANTIFVGHAATINLLGKAMPLRLVRARAVREWLRANSALMPIRCGWR